MRVQSAKLATEPAREGFERRGFEHARAFQNRVAEWAHDDTVEPVAVLRAPTGAGKTATFYEVIDENNLTLVVYPTNALLKQQLERFREWEAVSAEPLNSDTLDGHGDERVENLLQLTDFYEGHDVVVTNPDILQAIIQDLYWGSTKPMQFFDRFDAVVYDEFHFYDDLAASGLLLQMDIMHDRRGTDVLLASATPNQSFVEFVEDELSLPVRDITAEYVSDGDQFRQPVAIDRHEARAIHDKREAVAERLSELVNDADYLDEPQVALVFNSVAASNDFHAYLAEEFPDVFEYAAKDNGFDTNDPDADLGSGDFFVLNTTSKGEVGLDYGIQTLFMETPATPSAFLQRFGRAGREHEAVVHLFGLDDMAWPDDLSYPEFVESVYDALGVHRSLDEEIATLRSLVGMRAAYALYSRMDDDEWFGPELFADFESVTEYGKWRGFFRDVESALENAGEFGSPVMQNSTTRKILDFARHCFGALGSLRGRSLPVDIRYPRGDRRALTSYDLLTTLRYYDIEEIESDGTLVVERRDSAQPVAITARFPGYENRPRNYSGSNSEIEQMFSRWIYPEIEEADLTETEVDEGLLRQFFADLSLPRTAMPIEVRYGQYVAYVNQDGIASVDIERRQV
ncbi:type I-D CRISPR-associated helicase Cas3' [Natrinema salaciae]|uniref:CRISPR-associated endonuclease/helicase Cas3 n=1 Tax=Natrinema salaciae TaxID=1186196 RepID=A0A1H9EWG0_9EURY|nr:type I-D CRISPR-associated helicase Cas3' [Natrinema salaciae]SEQ30096.1 CRISPR-associated endonuclease/helicase Cas3 [Natrinema salaciae]